MAIIANLNTSQKPMSTAGVTGTQSFKFIPGPRIYMKSTPDSTSAAVVPSTKSNGTTPSGWTDLGVVQGAVKVGYVKRVKEVTTGIDNYLRAAYTDMKTGHAEFTLAQTDDVVMQNITGLSPSVIQAGSSYTFHMGQEDLTSMALLMVVQNKLDGKEWQFYSPLVYMNFSLEDQGDMFAVKCTGILPFFTATGQTKEEILSATIFA